MGVNHPEQAPLTLAEYVSMSPTELVEHTTYVGTVQKVLSDGKFGPSRGIVLKDAIHFSPTGVIDSLTQISQNQV